MRRAGWAAVLLLAAAAAVFAAEPADAPVDYGRVPAFSLIDQTGQPVTRDTLAGDVWIADFIFTRCAGQCPMMSVQMAALQNRFHDTPDVRLVSFTVDPAHDTLEVLAAYAGHYGAVSPRWRFLTGDRDALWGLARDGFKLGVSDDGTTEEPIVHSIRLVLVDRQGRIRGYYDATEAMAVERLVRDARLALSEARAE